jgi:hypothetical protein
VPAIVERRACRRARTSTSCARRKGAQSPARRVER